MCDKREKLLPNKNFKKSTCRRNLQRPRNFVSCAADIDLWYYRFCCYIMIIIILCMYYAYIRERHRNKRMMNKSRDRKKKIYTIIMN